MSLYTVYVQAVRDGSTLSLYTVYVQAVSEWSTVSLCTVQAVSEGLQ